ncbi:DUF5817 domain-containing protein [uncultured Methanomethylovorans sp.]|uniref:DUF5817 domain-containing protein n=1 Tax=uncultured Methanomethylovorans sp. TaxID=183759 RepID=UPI002AA87EC6|nr:hypothetical protein [uncultured Methanomethylovorans sp.]
MYGVIVCTKCKLYAQIIEVGTSRTVQCHMCGARLQVRKLQLLNTSEGREDAVRARTLIQAKLRANGSIHTTHTQSFQCNISQNNSSVVDICLTEIGNVRKIRSRDPATIILENINYQGEMSMEELEEKCTSLDIDKDVVTKVIARLLEAGDIYFPAKGRIKKV